MIRKFHKKNLQKNSKPKRRNTISSFAQAPLAWMLPVLLSTAIFACDTQNTYRDSINQRDDAYTNAKLQELLTVEGDYRGKMSLSSSGDSFDCVVHIQHSMSIKQISQDPNDQTETVEEPKLEGNLQFPVLANLEVSDLPSYSELTDPMGGYTQVSIDFGDYNPRNQSLILPYDIPGYSQGSFGELNGTLSNNHFQGRWFSKATGDVGTFDLIFNPQASPPTTPGGSQ